MKLREIDKWVKVIGSQRQVACTECFNDELWQPWKCGNCGDVLCGHIEPCPCSHAPFSDEMEKMRMYNEVDKRLLVDAAIIVARVGMRHGINTRLIRAANLILKEAGREPTAGTEPAGEATFR
jgi:hypothetical protein